MSVVYTAKRSLLPYHRVGEQVFFDIALTEEEYGRDIERSEQRSLGGSIEVRRHRADTMYDITFEPVYGQRRLQMREFLNSVESGEAFTLYLYGNEATPLPVKRIDKSAREASFMRQGSAARDIVTVTIRVLVIE